MNRKSPTTFATLAALTIATFAPVVADDLDLDWYTIDGGGEMWTTGGDFELTAGFWAPFAARVKPVPPESVEPVDDALEEAGPQPLP
jgi:hypothetical protein